MVEYFPQSDTLDSQASKLTAITPNDAADLADTPKALWVSVTGTLAVVAAKDTANTGTQLGTVPAGTVIPIRVRRVMATGTTATVIALG